MTQERVLIVGGAGFIGSALAAELGRQSVVVTVLDSFQQFADPFSADHTSAARYRATQLSGCEVIRGDARNPLDMLRAFEAARPTRVVHLAAVARAPLNEELRADAISTASTSVATTLELSARHSVRRVLLVSSSYVYGDFLHSPCGEAHPTEPRTVYGTTKLMAEVLVRGLSVQMELEHTVVRLIAVYGPWDLNGRLSVQNLQEASRTGLLPIAGGAGEATDYTHVDDAVRGLCLALTHPDAANITVNIARGRARTPDEVTAALTALGTAAHPSPERIGPRPRRGALDISRARAVLGFSPTIDIEDGLADCLAAALGDRQVVAP